MTFDQWWLEFRKLSRQFNLILMHRDFYREYWEDGDSPVDAAKLEAKHRKIEEAKG
jgi:hypothetical protein